MATRTSAFTARLMLTALLAVVVAAAGMSAASAEAENATAGPGRLAAAMIAAGDSQSCALLDNSTVKCWGGNEFGQLGQGDTANRGDDANEMGADLDLVDLGPGRTATAVAAGNNHMCALLNNGTVKCWGDNFYGQLGQGNTIDRGDDPAEMGANLRPVDLGPGRTATAVAAGANHACALLDNGTVKCWGRNTVGQLGLGDTTNRGDDANEMGTNLRSVDLGPGRTATAVTAGANHTCALLDDGTLKCWGFNEDGQLGRGDTTNRGDAAGEMGANLPAVDLGPGRTATAISGGDNHTCTVLDNGTVKCWGDNADGQLGQGDTTDRGDNPTEMGTNLMSVDLGSGRTATAVSAGDNHTCALLDDDTVKCWGVNADGQLGQGDTTNRGDAAGEMGADLPSVDLGPGRTVAAVSAGDGHSCALLDDDTVKCWGQNTDGQLGQGDTENRGDDPNEMGANLGSIDLGPPTSTLPPPCPTTPTGFTDVPTSSFAFADIACIKGLGITTGTTPTTYDPAGNVTREQMAAFLARIWRKLGNPCATTPTGFTDVPTSSFAFADIACIKALGITTGTTPTTYSPADNVTREQLAAFLGRLWRALDNVCPTTPTGFTDVRATSFAAADVRCIKALGITTGTSPTTYSPADNVTREQMAAFLARLWRVNRGDPA